MTTKFFLGATAVMTLAGLAILKLALDSLDDLASDNAETDAAIESDGWVTLHPAFNQGRN